MFSSQGELIDGHALSSGCPSSSVHNVKDRYMKHLYEGGTKVYNPGQDGHHAHMLYGNKPSKLR